MHVNIEIMLYDKHYIFYTKYHTVSFHTVNITCTNIVFHILMYFVHCMERIRGVGNNGNTLDEKE